VFLLALRSKNHCLSGFRIIDKENRDAGADIGRLPSASRCNGVAISVSNPTSVTATPTILVERLLALNGANAAFLTVVAVPKVNSCAGACTSPRTVVDPFVGE
jgi:hypothetical protein